MEGSRPRRFNPDLFMSAPPSLPYHDTKPQGAPDFYFCINATFRFIRERLGEGGLRRYWEDLGTKYFRPVSLQWKAEGLPAVAQYWRDFFAAEPGGAVEVLSAGDIVEVRVRECPAIRHLRASGRAITPEFCQHCYFVSEAIAAPAGLTVRVVGGNGACEQRFFAAGSGAEAQDLRRITSCA